jgi:hypothetical protein
MSATGGQIIDQVLDRLAESETSPIFWTRAELLTLLNEGFLEFTLMASQLTSERTYALIGAKAQSVPDGAIAIINVQYANQKIEKSSIENFDRANPLWDGLTGILTKWAPCGLDRWFCDRTPTAAYNVTLTTLDEPGEIDENTVIDLEMEYIEGLTSYVYHGARFKESGAELQQSMEAYDQFRSIAGHKAQKTFAAEFTVWGRDPDADSGKGYSTIDRS